MVGGIECLFMYLRFIPIWADTQKMEGKSGYSILSGLLLNSLLLIYARKYNVRINLRLVGYTRWSLYTFTSG